MRTKEDLVVEKEITNENIIKKFLKRYISGKIKSVRILRRKKKGVNKNVK